MEKGKKIPRQCDSGRRLALCYGNCMRFVASLASASLFCGLWSQPAPAQGLSNRRAPSFSLPDSNLRQYDLLDYRGKWLLLAFTQSNCPHCMELSRKLEPIKQKYAGKAEVLSVMISPPANQQTVAAYVAETKITSPVVFDQGQVAVSYFKATPQNPSVNMPHLFAINPQGTIVRDWAQNDMQLPGFPGEIERLISTPAKK